MSARRIPAGGALLAVLLLLAGCGDPLDTTYGRLGGASVNGLQIMRERWQRDFGMVDAYRLGGSKIAGRDLLVHVALQDSLPDQAACEWIEEWLRTEDDRQFVLVLRDGNVAPWLCRRWADEARGEAARTSGAQADELTALAASLVERADEEDRREPALVLPGRVLACPLFSLKGVAAHRPEGLSAHAQWGAPPAQVPATLALRSQLVIGDSGAESLLAVDERPFVAQIPFGGSRLVLVLNATPLLDGALVDPAARALLDGLTRCLATWTPDAAVWIQRLWVSRGDPEPPNILAMLFGKPPFNHASFHLLALALVFLAWKAAWLGRVSPLRGRSLERFSRHVDALAWHLRLGHAHRACVDAIAKHLRREPGAPPRDAADGREQVAGWYAAAGDPGSPAVPAAPASAAPASSPPPPSKG